MDKHYKIDFRVHKIPRRTLSWVQKCLLSLLKFRCNHKGRSWWSNDQLAAEFQTTRRTIQDWCRKLERLGLIVIHRREGRRNEISVPDYTDRKMWDLGARWTGGVGNCTGGVLETSPPGVESNTPSIKGKPISKKKNGGGAAGRASLESMWGDKDVIASSDRAVAASEKRTKNAVRSPDGAASLPVSEAPPPEDWEVEGAKPDEGRLGRWTNKMWAKAFVDAMQDEGYQVTFAKYNTVNIQVGAIKDHLLNRGFSRLKIYRFLLEWFPKAYPGICSRVFKKSPDDLMFSVSWMEPRLDDLVRLNEGDEKGPSWADKVTIME
jgi:hypothetical protein